MKNFYKRSSGFLFGTALALMAFAHQSQAASCVSNKNLAYDYLKAMLAKKKPGAYAQYNKILGTNANNCAGKNQPMIDEWERQVKGYIAGLK